VENPEDRKGYGPSAGGRSDRGGGAEPYSCTERDWRYDNAALLIGRNPLTGNVRIVGTLTVYALDRKVVNGQMPDGGGYGKEMKGKERVVGTSSWVDPNACEGVECVDEVLGREVLG